MKLFKNLPIILLVAACAVVSIACSNGKSPVAPSSDDVSGISNDLPATFGTFDDSRNILAVYDAVIDPVSKTFTISPVDRTAQFHYPLTQLNPSVLQITSYGWTPNFWADIKLRHPFPVTGINGYDPRVIAIIPSNPGVRFVYPVMGVDGNDAVVLEPDGYTRLFDSLGGTIPGNVNPFKAYFKDQPYRVWSGAGVIEETQRWQMSLEGFGGPLQFKLVVDVSTNYPNPPQPIIDNAKEPVEIDAVIGEGLTDQGGSAPIEVRLKHWKDITEVGGVEIESPDLFDDTLSIQYYSYSPYYSASVFKGTLDNENFAEGGTHNLMIKSWDAASGIQMFNEFSADVSYHTDDGSLIWAKRAGGVYDDQSFGITTLSDNSTVTTGRFWDSATFGPGEINQTVLTSAGHSDIFIARYNPDGTLAWAKRAGGTSHEIGFGITTLSDNSIVATGCFREIATFGPGETNQTVLHSVDVEDIFIARYNPDGTLAWAKSAGGPNRDYGSGITTLSDNAIVVTGYFYSTATFGPGETNQTILTSAGDYDIFIARYNPDGTLSWAKRAGGSNDDRGEGITTLSDDSTIVTGYFNGSANFGQSEPNQTVLTSFGGQEMFVARYDLDGTLAWAKSAGGTSDDYGCDITKLLDNSAVITGWFSSIAIFGHDEINQTVLISEGDWDAFIARYNPDGTLSWAKRAGGSSGTAGHGITTLWDNSITITGYFSSSATFGQNELNETVLSSTGGLDIFVARYNLDGTLFWAKSAGGTHDDYGCDITELSDNSTVVTGFFSDSATFGPGEPNETILTSAGYNDIFIARFEP